MTVTSPRFKKTNAGYPYSALADPLADVSTHWLNAAIKIANFAGGNAAAVDCIGGFPAKEFDLLAEAGFLSAPLHTAEDGAGLGFQSEQTGLTLKVLQQIGRGNLSLGRVYEGHVNALQPLPNILALARNLALNLYRDHGFDNMAQAQRKAGQGLHLLKSLFRMK